MPFPPWALLVMVMTGWVAADAARRQRNWFAWAGAVAMTGPIALMVWLIARRRPGPPATPGTTPPARTVMLTIAPLFLLTILISVVLTAFVFQVARVEGRAMSPTLRDMDRLIVSKLAYRRHSPQRGDIVMLNYPVNPAKKFVMRVVAEPGDLVWIDDGNVYVNDERAPDAFVSPESRGDDDWGPRVIESGYYFVMGDRRNDSSDSRHWGLVPEKYILGRVAFRWWPPGDATRY